MKSSATMTASNVSTPFSEEQTETAARSLLVVDDEPVIRMIARTCLSTAGFTVVEAGDEAGAFEAIQKAATPFELIMLDLTLGETDGADLIPGFRRQSPTTRILVVSGLGAEVVEGLDADGFLGKPFTKKSLLIAVEQALRKET
jgi:DNA-binding response OmpR family regulator